MSKTRVSIVAERLGVETKEVLARLKSLGYDVKSGASTVDDEAVAKLSVSQAKDSSSDEVRVTSTIVRRRAKPAAESSGESPADEVSVEPAAKVAEEAAVAEKKPLPAVEKPVESKPAVEQPVAEKPVVEKPKKQAEPEKAVVEKAAPEKPVAEKAAVQKVAEEVKEAKTPEAQAAEAQQKPKPAPAAAVVPEPAKPAAQPEVTTSNKARILGRVEIPITPEYRSAPRRDQGRPQGAGTDSRPPRPAGAGGDNRGPRPASGDSRPPRPANGTADARGQRPSGPPRPVQLTPVDIPPPSAGDRRKAPPGAKKATTKDNAGAKPGKKGMEVKKGREQFTKQGLLSREDRLYDPFHKNRKKGSKERDEPGQTELTTPKAIKRIIRISETITVGELAKRLGIKATDLIKSLMKMGMMVTINHVLDHETAAILASEYSYEVENVAVDLDEIMEFTPDAPEDLEKRPPVVTIMGHVDHGKTSLLDAIREANVIAGEAGGITQHIGAYDVELHGRKITFLDTPGHEAFTAMRARGAKVTDIVILVVAADDGVMPQTKEAINHSKAAEVPIIVAINKVDKPDAKPERVKQELTEHGLVASDWGGDTTMVEVSAKKRMNLEELLEMILLQADLMDMKANPNKSAKGTIVEGKLDKGRGPVATVLVQEGTLKVGDYCVVGVHSGRVRAMQNDRGERVLEAGPSMPVELIGLSGVPDAGDIFAAMKDEKQAREIATLRQIKQREMELAKHSKMSLEELYKRIQSGEVKDLNVIIKADVQGSVEAVAESLRKLSTEAVRLNVIHSAVGAITETDVNLATASNAIIIGFNIRPEVKAQGHAEKEGVDIRLYNVIYDAVDDVRKAMEGLLSPTFKEKYLGRVEIREVFSVPKIGNVGGCYVLDGKVPRNAQVRLLRDNVVVYEGKLSSLRRFKDDVKEVATGYECGMGLENYNDIKVGDIIEAFEMEKFAAKL
jgi:translation initiation factor IF-2